MGTPGHEHAVRPGKRPELVQYHMAWTWPEQSMDWMKSMLLFFDGVAWLLPADECDRMLDADPVLAAPLHEAGLLRNFEPGTWLTEPIAREIRAAARAAVAYRNRWPDSEDYSRRSMSHLFSPHDREADAFIAELVTAGAILPPGECWGGEVFVREPVFQVIMTVLALGARAVLHELDLHLAAKPGQYADGFTLAAALEALGAPRRKLAIPDDQLGIRSPLRHGPGTGFIALQFTSDMQDVGVDLTGVPLEEVLDFRRLLCYLRGPAGIIVALAE